MTLGTNPRAELLAAVLAAPDDDEPRLVMADFLLERGAPRGQFIADQCALARRGLSPARRARTLARATDALTRHGEEWFAPARAIGATARFRRGFIAAIDALAAPFLSGGRTLIESEPVTRMVLRGTTAATARSLVESDLLARVHQLTLLGDIGGDIGGAGAVALALSPHLGNLRRLNLRGSEIGPVGARALAASATLRPAMLGLNGNVIGDQGAVALAGSPVLSRVAELYLARNDIGDDGVAALARSPHVGALRVLGLDGNERITDRGARALLETTGLSALRRLELSQCDGISYSLLQELAARWRLRAP